jgi:hypothetical protein
MHDHAVDLPGTYEVALEAIELAKSKGFRVQVNCTVFDGADPDRLAAFFDEMKSRDVEITVSPGYAYERAADQEHFLNRERTKQFFRDVFSRGNKGKNWAFTNSPLFLDFLAGNQTYECTPWSMPLRTVFGWQKPCYLLGEGYVETFRELMEGTDWEKYGVGKYEKCANCMTHCGFEGTAATDAIRHPLKMMKVARKGVKTDGPMAPNRSVEGAPRRRRLFKPRRARTRQDQGRKSRCGQARGERGLASGTPARRGGPCGSARAVAPGSGPARPAPRPAPRPIGLHADLRRRRQRFFGAIGNDPHHRERQPRRAATRAATWLSISTASAPVSARKARLPATVAS